MKHTANNKKHNHNTNNQNTNNHDNQNTSHTDTYTNDDVSITCIAVGTQGQMITTLWMVRIKKTGSAYLYSPAEIGEIIHKYGGKGFKLAVFREAVGTVEIWEIHIPKKVIQ
ncbi:MAG: hypothetical protein Q7J08_01120 [Methanocorpusculum sp.]|uniref:hypothetical protein n=1 Tax=Methanocorpusculum sp. TaxID=2058474 RepID=UPI0027226F7D|nr:hypothetical protein [Methanocorpusculum sp.]MDO9522296.1 hypothetical protein [Methanocorpusculum sp.]